MTTQRAEPAGQKVQAAVRAAVVPGTLAAVLSTAALATCSKLEQGRAAGAINAPSQWLWGEAEAYTKRPTLRHTAVGYAIHHATSIFWAALHELAFGSASGSASNPGKSVQRVCTEAAVTTATAYVVDYYLTPRRFQPGFEKHLGPLSMFLVYAAFGAGLAAAGLARRHSSR